MVELQVFAVFFEVFRDLQRQFAGRFQDQAARHARLGTRSGQDIQHGQHEGRGFACAGLRTAQHIAPHQHLRDCLFLNGCGVAIARFRHRLHNFLRQADGIESGAVFVDAGCGFGRSFFRHRGGLNQRGFFRHRGGLDRRGFRHFGRHGQGLRVGLDSLGGGHFSIFVQLQSLSRPAL